MEFELKAKINASPEQIYNTWLSSEGHSKMTGGTATITGKVGDKFTAWDGYIHGKIIDLEPYIRILQTWRTSQFKKDEEDSLTEILLNEIDGQTQLTLNHTNVPDDGQHYIEGWENHYFTPMKNYFNNSNN